MNIPDADPKAAIIYCAKCGNPCAIVIVPFLGTLVSAICPHCRKKLVDEALTWEERVVPE